MSKRVLFVLKQRPHGEYGCWDYCPQPGRIVSSGLHNSVKFVVDMLNDHLGIEAKVVTVVDNNSIDREVFCYKPTDVIVEAFWVVPEKFDVLKRLHPTVKWWVRDHSKSEFLAQEGVAFGWSIDYMRRGITLACNSEQAREDMRKLAVIAGVDPKYVGYLPNYYPYADDTNNPHRRSVLDKFHQTKVVDIGCFGAIRPLKNHINQALAALDFVNDIGGSLHYHINSTRIEGEASPMLHNLRNIFMRLPNHQLVEHEWLDHPEFKALMKTMAISTQVSFSETFNIVSADAIDSGVVAVGSNEIPWLPEHLMANPASVESISRTLRRAWVDIPVGHYLQIERKFLMKYSNHSAHIWEHTFGE